LDIKYQLQILNIVKKLDITVVAALHDLNIAAMYCDELYVIKNGSIMAHGAPKKILTTSLLKEIYEVDTKIIEDNETGVIHILFSPSMA
jgi:iron complex transport system ATP-binding protein